LLALPKIFDWFSCSGWKNGCSSEKNPNFDGKLQKSGNDSSYQLMPNALHIFSSDGIEGI
jgi:hypothetical protein